MTADGIDLPAFLHGNNPHQTQRLYHFWGSHFVLSVFTDNDEGYVAWQELYSGNVLPKGYAHLCEHA